MVHHAHHAIHPSRTSKRSSFVGIGNREDRLQNYTITIMRSLSTASTVLSFFLLVATCLSYTTTTTRRTFGTTRLYSDEPSHSFVEGASFDSRMEEIEAMGGDPFFMIPGDDKQEDSSTEEDSNISMMASIPFSSALGSILDEATGDDDDEEPRFATDGKGPTPSRKVEPQRVNPADLWDGTVDEDAHLGF